MKHQLLFSLKDKIRKKIKVLFAANLLVSLRINSFYSDYLQEPCVRTLIERLTNN